MTREHLEESCEDYLDGSLSAQEMDRWREHVAGCAQCRKDLEEIDAVRRSLRAMAPPQLSPAFLERLHQEMRAYPPPLPAPKPVEEAAKAVPRPRWWDFFRQPLGGFALAAATAIALLAFFSPAFKELWQPASQGERGESIKTDFAPLRLEVQDVPAAVNSLKHWLVSHESRLIAAREIDEGTRLTVVAADEKAFLAELETLGRLGRRTAPFRDQGGAIVLIVTR
ncbi:MAG: zf-HC2 domain-containing protein [Acidobacteria bacterium]|nr:zf-HC2 domain-containing protein [Acidobacteriota bacterium]